MLNLNNLMAFLGYLDGKLFEVTEGCFLFFLQERSKGVDIGDEDMLK